MPCGGCKTDCKCTGQKCGDSCGKGSDCKCGNSSSKTEVKNSGGCCKGKGSCH